MSDPITSRLAEVQGRLDAVPHAQNMTVQQFRDGSETGWLIEDGARWRGSDVMLNALDFGDDKDTAELFAHAGPDLVWALSVIRQQQETIEKARSYLPEYERLSTSLADGLVSTQSWIDLTRNIVAALTAPTTEKEND